MNHYIKIILKNLTNLNATPLERERIMALKKSENHHPPYKKEKSQGF